MSAAAGQAGKVAVDPNKPFTCYVCSQQTETPPISCGCGCRGLAGYAHQDCAIGAAREEWERWFDCQVCNQRWAGPLKLALARARTELMEERPETDPERQHAQEMLADALADTRRFVAKEAERKEKLAKQRSAGNAPPADARTAGV